MEDSLKKRIKRGEASWSFFWTVYAILLAITLTVIGVIPFTWYWKLCAIVLSPLLLGWLCFSNARFQNKIIGLKVKLQNKWRKI